VAHSSAQITDVNDVLEIGYVYIVAKMHAGLDNASFPRDFAAHIVNAR
jgi:hypothetical protein